MKKHKATQRARQERRKGGSKLRVLVLPAIEGLIEVPVRSKSAASIIAHYWNSVRYFLETGDDALLREFRGISITSASGDPIDLLTDLDELERLGTVGVFSFESIYAKVR